MDGVSLEVKLSFSKDFYFQGPGPQMMPIFQEFTEYLALRVGVEVVEGVLSGHLLLTQHPAGISTNQCYSATCCRACLKKLLSAFSVTRSK